MSRQRLEPAIARELSRLMPRLKDPRIPLIVTVERVSLARDGRHAKVAVSTLDGEDVEAMLTALNRAGGYLQHELAESLALRYTPKLTFEGAAPLPATDEPL